ncbi:MAG: hypothetical protein Pg6C_05850 [Treponemataceae bacterium]|nr:MAG: hypothetical protein Pg6C_05850 [Treponemataceae bacterium]
MNSEGKKEVLGFWTAENEGAKFWTGVLSELKNRGVEGILVACMDGLSGFPGAARAACPQTRVRLCIARMARNSAKFVSYKDLKKVCADLKAVYAAAEEAGRQALADFGESRNANTP